MFEVLVFRLGMGLRICAGISADGAGFRAHVELKV